MTTEGIKSFIKECFDKQTQELKDFLSLELPEDFKSNPYFSEKSKQGIATPSGKYSIRTEENECFQKDGHSYPHLYHTFDPQLNNISDMIRELLDCACNKKQKSIIDDLEKSRELLIKIIEKHDKGKELVIPKEEINPDNQKMLLEIIDSLNKITNRQEENRCITIKDLEALQLNSSKEIQQEKVKPLEIDSKPQKGYKLSPLWRL